MRQLPVLCASAMLAAAPLASRADLLAQFRNEYPAAAAKLVDAYSHVTIVATDTRTDHKGAVLWTDRTEYLREGDLVRAVQTIVSSNSPSATVGFVRVFGGGSQKCFDIHKRPTQQEYTFEDFGAKSDEEFSNAARMACLPAFAPYCADGVRIDKFVAVPAVRLLSATPITLDGTPVIDVLAELVGPGLPHTQTHLYFLPGSWAFAGWTNPVLFENQSMKDPHNTLELRVAYTGNDPLKLKSVNRWTTPHGLPGVKVDEQRFAVESIDFGPVPADKFTLASLGVDEPAAPRARPVGGGGVRWLPAAVAGLCAALGVWLAVLARRRTRKTA